MNLSCLLSSVKSMCVVSQGNINFGHQYLNEAVSQKYLLTFSFHFFSLIGIKYSDPNEILEIRNSLVNYWRQVEFDKQAAPELPWLLVQIFNSPACGDKQMYSIHLLFPYIFCNKCIFRVLEELKQIVTKLENIAVYLNETSLRHELLQYRCNILYSLIYFITY